MRQLAFALAQLALLVCACGSGDSRDSGPTSNGDDGGLADTASSDDDAGTESIDGASGPDARSGGDGGADSLTASFVFVGCNRLQKGDWDTVANPSSANLPELTQTFADVVALTDVPSLFFFTGDLVLGLKSDPTLMAGQLDAWAQMYKANPIAAKVPVVPLVGNHEMLYKDKTSGLEFSNGPSDAVWTDWLTAQGFAAHAGNGPTKAPPNADALEDDQSKLSYSFDQGRIHYVVLNTDTWTTTADGATQSTKLGWIALQWLTADLAAAQANPSVSSIFVFGHKPIISPTGGSDGDSAISPSLVPGLEAALDGTAKVKGYFCAHAHEWDARKLPGTRGVYQIVAGNGGSQLEPLWTDPLPYFGFTEARVYKSGRVGIVSHRRPAPTPYNAASVTPATPVAELTIAL